MDHFDTLVKIITMPSLPRIESLMNGFFDKHGQPPSYSFVNTAGLTKIFDELSWALVVKPFKEAQISMNIKSKEN